MQEESYSNCNLNQVQKKFVDSYLAQKNAVNQLLQDCIINNKKIENMEQEIKEHVANIQSKTSENKQIKEELEKANKELVRFHNIEVELKNTKGNFNKLNNCYVEQISRNKTLEFELNELNKRNEINLKEKSELAAENSNLMEQIKVFEAQKNKIDQDLLEMKEFALSFAKQRQDLLDTIEELETKLSNKDKELQEVKENYENTLNEKQTKVESMVSESIDVFATYVKKMIGSKNYDSTKNETIEKICSSSNPFSVISNSIGHTSARNSESPPYDRKPIRNSSYDSRKYSSENNENLSHDQRSSKSRLDEYCFKRKYKDYDDEDTDSTTSSNSKSKHHKRNGFFDIDKTHFNEVYNLYNSYYSTISEDLKLFENLLRADVRKEDLNYLKLKSETLCQLYRDKNTQRIDKNKSKYLSFKLNENYPTYSKMCEVMLKPFEIYTEQLHLLDHFKIINTGGDVTAMDWLANKYIENISLPKPPNKVFEFATQFFAYAVKPSAELSEVKFEQANYKDEDKLKLEEEIENCFKSGIEPNLIYICRCFGLNYKNQSVAELFAIYNDRIGTANCLKWRNNYAPLFNYKNSDHLNFLGYLLVASSNGNGYIYLVHDMISKNPSFGGRKDREKDILLWENIECYKPEYKIVLKRTTLCGQCLSADWLQSNNSSFIALGYSDGSIAIYDLTSCKDLSTSSKVHIIYPTETVKTHNAPVKILKWSKSNKNFKLVSGTTNDIQIWNFDDFKLSSSSNRKMGSINDFDLTFFNELVACNILDPKKNDRNVLKSINLNENENKPDRSPFITNSSMTGISISDYLNKLFVCDSEGNVILSNNPKSWNHPGNQDKDQFLQVAKFVKVIENDENVDYFRPNPIIIDLTRVSNTEGIIKSPIYTQLQNDSITASVTLQKIKVNPNPPYLNWYLCSGPGFIFLHRISEIYLNAGSINDILCNNSD